MRSSFESSNVGAFAVPQAGAVLPHRYRKGRAVLPESKNMAEKPLGFPRNLGDPAVSTGFIGCGGVAEPEALPVHRRCVLGRWKRMPRRTVWYRQAKATKRGGTVGGKS
jgi:hypothetical protein